MTVPLIWLIHKTLEALRAKGVKNAVLTNKPDAVACSLIGRFFGSLIDICVGQTPDSISKPDSRSMDGVLQALGVSRDEVVYIGDTDVDMQTAHNTHTTAAAAVWGYQPLSMLLPYEPTFIVRTPQELIPIFQEVTPCFPK